MRVHPAGAMSWSVTFGKKKKMREVHVQVRSGRSQRRGANGNAARPDRARTETRFAPSYGHALVRRANMN
eukprot:2730941-Prymnesium_polylepis.1